MTLSSPGYTDAWIDFNVDGDWDDPGEKILDAVRFSVGDLTRTFQIKVPDTAPIPAVPTTTFARFRSSGSGGLVPTGLAVDGEVEDYAVIIVPGTPPTAVNDTFSFNEDSTFTTTDPNGLATPGFSIDDGVAANDQDSEGGVAWCTSCYLPNSFADIQFEFGWNVYLSTSGRFQWHRYVYLSSQRWRTDVEQYRYRDDQRRYG